MKKLTIKEKEFKEGLAITLKGLKDYNWDWHVDIRKYDGGGYKFFINAAGASNVYTYHEYGDCSGDYAEIVAFKGIRPSSILNDYVRDLMDELKIMELWKENNAEQENNENIKIKNL